MVDLNASIINNPVSIGGLAVGFGLLVLLVIGVYIYCALALRAIAKKTNTQKAWLAWIPIGNFILMTRIAEVSGWWVCAIFFMFIPVLGYWLWMASFIYMFWRIAPKIGFDEWTSLFMLIPLGNLIMLGIYAWKGK